MSNTCWFLSEMDRSKHTRLYESETVSGYGLFGLFGIEWEGLGGLIGLRYYSVDYAEFKSTTTSDKLGIAYSIGSADLILGIEYSF